MAVEEIAQAPEMGQCTVTGKMVPADELVTIQGQLVCAEGKAILLERLKAGEALPGELERPPVFRRFCCIFLDGLIIGVPTAIIMALVAAATAFGSVRGGGSQAVVVSMVALVMQTVQFLYFALMHGSRGQTVGKMAGNLIVIRQDGRPINMSTAFIRAIAYLAPNMLQVLLGFAGNNVLQIIGTMIVGVYGLISIIVALTDSSQQRALHDRIAGTRVVMKP